MSGFISAVFSQERVARFRSGRRNGVCVMILEILSKVQRYAVVTLAGMLVVVLVLSTAHLGVLICQEIWQPPRFLIRVQGLLDIFGYFLLVMIGIELIETLKAYVRKEALHVRVVLEVALIAMARKVIIEEPNNVSSLTLFGIAALILALGIAYHFERQGKHVVHKPELQALKEGL
jgi:uncharacterized membrane protein (DUF373 family)